VYLAIDSAMKQRPRKKPRVKPQTSIRFDDPDLYKRSVTAARDLGLSFNAFAQLALGRAVEDVARDDEDRAALDRVAEIRTRFGLDPE